MGRRLLLTPAGGALIAICFFLPWFRISCMGSSSYSGMDCGGVYWAIFGAGVLIAGAFWLLRRWKRLELMPTVVSIASFVSAAVIIYGVLAMAGGKRILLFRVGPGDVNLRLQLGAYGVLFGFFLAWTGVSKDLRLRRRRKTPKTVLPVLVEPEVASPPEVEVDHTSA